MDLAAPSTPTPNTPTMASHTGYAIFPKPPPRVIALTTFGKSKSGFEGVKTDDVSDFPHAQYKLSLPTMERWRRPSPCCCRRPETTSSTSQTNSRCTRTMTTWQSSSTGDTFLSDAIKYPMIEESTSKATWGLKALVVRGTLTQATNWCRQDDHLVHCTPAQRSRQEARRSQTHSYDAYTRT